MCFKGVNLSLLLLYAAVLLESALRPLLFALQVYYLHLKCGGKCGDLWMFLNAGCAFVFFNDASTWCGAFERSMNDWVLCCKTKITMFGPTLNL